MRPLGSLLLFALLASVPLAGCDSGGGSCPRPAPPVVCGEYLGNRLPARAEGSTVGVSDEFFGSSCASGGIAADAAFTWTAPAAGRYHISTAGSDFDTLVFVREGGCEGREIGCNDDANGELTSEVSLDLESCQTITVIVDGFDEAAEGNFVLTIEGTETSCEDGRDDDGDGMVDCEDPDCFSAECAGVGDYPPAWSSLEEQMLQEVNRYRAMGATCDTDVFGPAPPLEMNETIRVGARLHSIDMGEQNYFEHDSLDGRTFSDRMRNTGFTGSGPWGENIAAGYGTAEEATLGLMNSPGHCRNIMNPSYRVIGIGYARTEGSDFGNYWTQNFAASH